MTRFSSAIAFLQNRAAHLRQSADLERECSEGSKGLAADCDAMADDTIAAMRVLADHEAMHPRKLVDLLEQGAAMYDDTARAWEREGVSSCASINRRAAALVNDTLEALRQLHADEKFEVFGEGA